MFGEATREPCEYHALAGAGRGDQDGVPRAPVTERACREIVDQRVAADRVARLFFDERIERQRLFIGLGGRCRTEFRFAVGFQILEYLCAERFEITRALLLRAPTDGVAADSTGMRRAQ